MHKRTKSTKAAACADTLDVAIRKARGSDVSALHRLVNAFADRKLMLPRSLAELYENLRDFQVAVADGEIVGCVAVHPVWEDLAEVKSLAVRESHHGREIGTRLVKRGLEDTRALGLARVFALTYRTGFFKRLGFRPIDKNDLPHKIWFECTRCPLFPDCKEEAVIIDLDESGDGSPR